MCGMIMGVIGGVMSAAGSIMQGNAQAASLKAQALFNKRQAYAEYLKGSTEIMQQKRNVERIAGAQKVGYGAAGISVDEGTPTDTSIQTQTEAEMDRQAIRFGRDVTVGNYMYKAKIDEMNAKQAKIAGMFGAVSALVNTGTQLSSSFPVA